MKKDKTLTEMVITILALGVIEQLILALFFGKYLYHGIGLWCGIGCAVFYAIHLKRSIEDSIDYGVGGAKSHARKQYMVRIMVVMVVIGVILYQGWGNPVTILLGVSALQVAAFVQPLMHKIFMRIEQAKKGGG